MIINYMEDYLYQDLTREIIGVAFTVYNSLGYGFREKIYQRGMSVEFTILKIPFQEECPVRIYYRDKIIGKYYIDFVVDNKVVVELKVANDFYTIDIKQVLSYLKANNLKLGLLIIFNKDGVKIKRIIN